MTKNNYFLSADFQANSTDISWQKAAFLVIQNYALLFLSWMAFSTFHGRIDAWYTKRITFLVMKCTWKFDQYNF